MRHGKKFNHLSRKAPHRKSMLSNMASSLIIHKKIETTVAKAKALRKYIEPILTRSKNDTTHSRRTVFSLLNNNELVAILEKITGHKVKKNYDRSKPKGVNSRSSDNTLVKKVLNWSPKISTEDGMARLFKYVNSEYHKK